MKDENQCLTLVRMMHEKFELEYEGRPRLLEAEEKAFRHTAMLEEVWEYMNAETELEHLDALIDLMVFAVGTLERHGFPMREPFAIVMEANMQKELAGRAENSKRGFSRDLVKPAGWRSADHALQVLLDGIHARFDKEVSL